MTGILCVIEIYDTYYLNITRLLRLAPSTETMKIANEYLLCQIEQWKDWQERGRLALCEAFVPVPAYHRPDIPM